MTLTQLHAWVDPAHPVLPNLALTPQQIADINAYLDALHEAPAEEEPPRVETEEPPPAIEQSPPEELGEPIEPSTDRYGRSRSWSRSNSRGAPEPVPGSALAAYEAQALGTSTTGHLGFGRQVRHNTSLGPLRRGNRMLAAAGVGAPVGTACNTLNGAGWADETDEALARSADRERLRRRNPGYAVLTKA